MNPYASEDFNRVRLTPKPKEDEGKIDHPLYEGKKIDMTQQELKTFTHAMGDSKFKDMMNDYVQEISDPKYRGEQDQYLKELEGRGELPAGTELIQPAAGFCIKTTSKKMVSDFKKTFFDQKTFINVCWHEGMEKPDQREITQPDGKKGTSWSLPYRVSKGKHDQDNQGGLCMTYDVVFHVDVERFVKLADFKKFVSDTAIDGVNRVLAEQKEKISADYKILKHINCKGVRPQMMTIKSKNANKLIANMDISKAETKLQKDIMKQQKEFKEGEAGQEEAQPEAATAEDSEEKSEESDQERPTSIVQPKFKIVHSYPVDMLDAWEGHKGTVEENQYKKVHILPESLTVTIFAKHAEGMKNAQLDIDESTLVFKYPELYYLDLNLKYKVDQDNGNAKFDKTKKTLTIKLPVVGSTEESQKVLDEHFHDFLEKEKGKKELLERLENTNIMEEMDKRALRKLPGQGDREDQENQENRDSMNLEAPPDEEEAMAGVSKPFIQSIDGQTTSDDLLDDKYGHVKDNIPESKEDDENKGRDKTAVKREEFLKIFKEENGEGEAGDAEGTDLSNGIRFRRDEDEQETGFTMKTNQADGSKPLIQELDVEPTATANSSQTKSKAAAQQKEKEIPFVFETAERVELKTNFIQQNDLVFLNIAAKGYKKDEDIRYAFSSDELLIEIRDRSTKKGVHQVKRLCQTLNKSIDVERSEVQLLVDFICVKLAKEEKSASWSAFGFDIANFNNPLTGQMKSNYLKSLAPEPVKEEEETVEEVKEEKTEITEEEREEKRQETIRQALIRAAKAQQCYFNLETSTIYDIF